MNLMPLPKMTWSAPRFYFNWWFARSRLGCFARCKPTFPEWMTCWFSWNETKTSRPTSISRFCYLHSHFRFSVTICRKSKKSKRSCSWSPCLQKVGYRFQFLGKVQTKGKWFQSRVAEYQFVRVFFEFEESVFYLRTRFPHIQWRISFHRGVWECE